MGKLSGNKAFIYILAILSMLFWGMSFVWTSIVFRYYNPITTIFLRLVISSLILFLVLIIFKKLEKIRRQDIGLFLISSLFNPFLYFLGENFGLKYTSPTISAVIIATIPVFTPVVAWFTLRERLLPVNIAGILISFAGIMIMLVNPDLSLNADPLGVALLFFAVVAAIGYSVLLKKLSERYSALAIITYQNMLGVLYFLPIFLVFDLDHFLQVQPDFTLVSSLIQLSVFASSLAYIFYTIVVRNIGISKTNVFTNTIPVFTAIFSYIFIAEMMGINKIAGIIIVISGVFLTQLGNKNNNGNYLGNY